MYPSMSIASLYIYVYVYAYRSVDIDMQMCRYADIQIHAFFPAVFEF